ARRGIALREEVGSGLPNGVEVLGGKVHHIDRELGGATPADVAKLTIYVVNFSPKNLDAIREAAPDFFPQRNPPAGIVIGVQSLPQEGLLIAVDATAVVRAMILPRDQRLQEKPY